MTLITLAISLVILASPLVVAPVWPQSQSGPWKVGVLWDVKEVPPRLVPLLDWLREDLKALGFTDKDLQFVTRQYENPDAALDAGRELIREGVHVIWTSSALPALAVRSEIRDTPIVFGVSADPVKQGLVQQWAKPGGNMTGVVVRELLPGKRLEILKEMVPGLRRVLVTPDPEAPYETARWLADIREAASQLRVTLVEYPISSKADVERLPEIIKRERVDALVHLINRTVNQYWEIVQKTLAEARVPDISYYLPAAEKAWVVAAYGVNHREAWRISARQLAKILRGARPQDLPVESPDVVELHINLRVAKERRIQIPQTVLLRAGKVFE